MRIIRYGLILTAAAIFLPSPPPDEARPTMAGGAARVDAGDMLVAATGVLSDVGQFCTRQPAVCDAALGVASTLEAKANYSIRLLYRWANEDEAQPAAAPADGGTAAVDPLITGSPPARLAEATSRNTLRLEDLIPEWRGPDTSRTG